MTFYFSLKPSTVAEYCMEKNIDSQQIFNESLMSISS